MGESDTQRKAKSTARGQNQERKKKGYDQTSADDALK